MDPVAGGPADEVSGVQEPFGNPASQALLGRRWQRDGTWHRILSHLQCLADAEGVIVWDLSVDSTVCRAHQHAAGAFTFHHRGQMAG